MNQQAIGPHPIGSFEVWVPIESFSVIYGWFLLNREDLSVMIHPLTRYELLDHTIHSTWMGTPMKLRLDVLAQELKEISSQYPNLRMGYASENSLQNNWEIVIKDQVQIEQDMIALNVECESQ